ncbi:MAG TPA: VanZ family protein [Rubrivivax sp.]|nr:VanZ family protein [Rubrivivax sp.]
MTGLPAGRLLAIYAAFVVYGSLVPLAYTPLPWAQAWETFKATPFLELGVESRADWIANGVLYLPLGWLAALLLARRHPVPLAVAIAWAGCTLLAVAVEFAQLHFPPRTVSQNDLLAEGLGSAIGALVAPLSAPWLQRAWSARNRANLVTLWLPAYALGYLALCFFPFDVLVSADELQAKGRSDMWAWVLAGGGPVAVLKLLVEAVLTAPLGLWLARSRGQLGLPWITAALAGAVFGVLVEVGQFFIASGVSQGASVATRAAGFVLGGWLAGRLSTGSLPLRSMVGRWAALWVPAWLLIVLAASGLLTRSWHGAAAAAAAWQEVRLLPFYYHYYTTEALALTSLGSVFLMYLPVAVLAWARRWRSKAAVTAAALLALLVEAAKLFVADRHPDPTNVLIAAAAAAAGLRMISLATAAPSPVTGAPAEQRPAPLPGQRWQLHPVLVLGSALALASVWSFPLASAMTLTGLLACAALTWRWPVLALALLPAALPVLDLAPWSGRFFWDEFDILCTVCLAVAWQRSRPSLPTRQPRWVRLSFAALALSLAASSVRALWPWPGFDDNSFNSYLSAFNALRIVKGAVWAALFITLWRRLHRHGDTRGRVFSGGVLAGLAITALAVVLERAAFVGVADFAADYRVTGLISAMHKGGAYIECWLAVASAFAVTWIVQPRAAWQRGAGTVLLVGCGYAMAVTYSRTGYAALAVSLVVTIVCTALGRRARQRSQQLPVWTGVVVVAVTAAIMWPVLSGTYARQRLAASAQDLTARKAHWDDGLRLRDGSLATTLVGLGVGRYPHAHLWRSAEPVRAATYGLQRDQQGPYLRLGTGATLYIEQIVPRTATAPLTLSLRLRSPSTAGSLPSLRVTLCEKWTLSSRNCVAATASVAATAAPGAWQTASVVLDHAGLTATGWPRPPLKLSLLTPEQAAVDVADVRLTSAEGALLLHNGDFAAGLDRWFFAADNPTPWQLDSLALTVLVEQGWLGLLAWIAVLGGALATAVRLAWQGRAEVPAAPAALLGFVACGALNTLIDAPRFLWLLLVLAWLCTRSSRPAGSPFPATTGPATAP